jgi:flagellar hook assembly protein FlgD
MDFAQSPGRRAVARGVVLIALLLAALVASAAAGLTNPTQAASKASDRPARAKRASGDAPAPRKLVLVVGPVGSATADFKRWGNRIAAAAESHGMQVVKIYTPCATWSRVTAEANGADLFVYLGHGSGFPRPGEQGKDVLQYEQERNRNGLGLNPTCGANNSATTYYGSNLVREQIRFAPNAIVLLNHLCYSAGDGEEWQTIPRRGIAVQRVDNFAAGFLAAGARTVFAWRLQPGDNLVDALYTGHGTMDDIFRTRFGSNSSGTWRAYYGWVGQQPDLYFDSERTPGARIHLDPDGPNTANTPVNPGPDANQSGYSRAVTGDLTMTTDEWLGDTGDPGDVEAPTLTGLAARQARNTLVPGDAAETVFTPNRDGLSDTLTIRHTVSEPAYLTVEIKPRGGKIVRRFTAWSESGRAATAWDGRNDAGKRVRDGRYLIRVTPRDRAGNHGRPRALGVRVLTSLKAPRAEETLLFPSDGDELAQGTTLTARLIRPATVGLQILNKRGNVARVAIDDQPLDAGTVTYDWDGTDDRSRPVPDGTYTAVFLVSTEAGTYGHKVSVRVGAFDLRGKLSVKSGERVRLTILAAEPMKGWPVVEVKQPGRDAYRLFLTRYSPTRFTSSWKVRPGAAGRVRITISGVDREGGEQAGTFRATLS